MTTKRNADRWTWVDSVLTVGAGLVVLGVLIGAFWAWPTYRVWSQKMTGKAELARADQNRQIAIREAEAAKESEILRAEGVAEANKIISDSLKNKSEYLTYLWIQGLQDGGNEVIYVPTEGNIPILEAGRIGVSK